MTKASDVAVDQQLSVVFRPDNAVRSESSGFYCATSLTGVFPEGRGKVDIDSGLAVLLGPKDTGVNLDPSK